jgi:methionine synthase II (cobalamin-independent)
MKATKQITEEIEIEDLVKLLPQAVSYLSENGIRCLRCGEPIWGSLKNAAEEKGFSEKGIKKFVDDLNKMLNKK